MRRAAIVMMLLALLLLHSCRKRQAEVAAPTVDTIPQMLSQIRSCSKLEFPQDSHTDRCECSCLHRFQRFQRAADRIRGRRHPHHASRPHDRDCTHEGEQQGHQHGRGPLAPRLHRRGDNPFSAYGPRQHREEHPQHPVYGASPQAGRLHADTHDPAVGFRRFSHQDPFPQGFRRQPSAVSL